MNIRFLPIAETEVDNAVSMVSGTNRRSKSQLPEQIGSSCANGKGVWPTIIVNQVIGLIVYLMTAQIHEKARHPHNGRSKLSTVCLAEVAPRVISFQADTSDCLAASYWRILNLQ